MICCLFDGGFRIEEFLNVRNEDVRLVDGDAPYYRITLRDEFSKTRGRIVSMLWYQSYDLIKSGIDFKPTSKDPQEQFFDSSYDGVRSMLIKVGGRSKIKLNPHLFRHSSATYYANKGTYNEYQINKRFGWTQGSDMGRRYVDENKIQETVQVKEYESGKLDDLRNKLNKQGEVNNSIQEKIIKMEKQNKIMLNTIKEENKLNTELNPQFVEVVSELRKEIAKQKNIIKGIKNKM
jgi:hypothetical protein